MGFDTTKIAVGAGECLYAPRSTRNTVTVKTGSTPTTTTFTVTATEAAKIRVGDILAAAGATPANTPTEASTSPRITSIAASGSDFNVTVSPAFAVAPAAAANLIILYHDLGATRGNIQFQIDVQTTEIEIDQSLDPVASILQSRKAMAMFPLAESSLQQFAVAAGLTIPAGGAAALDIGQAAAGAAPENRFLAILPGPAGKKRYVLLHRGVCSGTAAMVASKTDPSVTECNVSCLPDSSLATGVNVAQILDV
jgi:hypothetical protein